MIYSASDKGCVLQTSAVFICFNVVQNILTFNKIHSLKTFFIFIFFCAFTKNYDKGNVNCFKSI